MSPVPHPTKFLSGYVYTGPGGEQVPLGLEDVIQIKMPNPRDPYRGLGPVQSILVDLDAIRYSAEWNRNFFLNSAEPGGIIEAPERLTDPEFKEFTERWREQHQGIGAAHRVAILEKMSWKDRSISQRDMQFVELRKVAREVVREAFGIHGHMLGLSEDVNKANAEAGAASFGKWLVRPRLERIKGVVNARLLPMFGMTAEGLELDHDDPEPPDRESDDRERTSKAQAFKTLIDAGVDPADAAMLCGWPSVKMVERPPAPAGGQAEAGAA
jgi:HK97 family phage portal protein